MTEETDKKLLFQEVIRKERIKESFNLAVKTKDLNLWLHKVISNLEDSKLIKILQNNLTILKIQMNLGKTYLKRIKI
jgi:hypothetical protein